jgi:uncharacterized protein YcnI
MKKRLRIHFAFAACVFAVAAQAHITLEYQVAPAASAYKATFRVGHGCGSSPTRQIAVSIPAGVTGARPMPKPGWSLDIQREGKQAVRVTWSAKTREDMLADGLYDEFVLVAQTPREAGAIYWPVSQVCEDGRQDWTEIPTAAQPLSQLKSPAAYLEILPAAGSAPGHQH